MVGTVGEARDVVTPDAPGYVRVHGELWRATSRVPVNAGQRVRVLAVNGLTLDVEPIVVSTREGATS